MGRWLEHAQDLKAKGDLAIRAQNYRDAWTAYTRALELLPPGCLNPRTLRIQDVSDISASGQLQQGHGHELEQHEQEEAQLLFRSLLSNRCLALSSAGRYQEAWADAQQLVARWPCWAKAWFRGARALDGLRLHTLALRHYARAWQLDPDPKARADCERSMAHTASRLTKPQLANELLHLLSLPVAMPDASEVKTDGHLPAPPEAAQALLLEAGADGEGSSAGAAGPNAGVVLAVMQSSAAHASTAKVAPTSLPNELREALQACGPLALHEAAHALVVELAAPEAAARTGWPVLAARYTAWLREGLPPHEHLALRAPLLLHLHRHLSKKLGPSEGSSSGLALAQLAAQDAKAAVSQLAPLVAAQPSEAGLDQLAHCFSLLGGALMLVATEPGGSQTMAGGSAHSLRLRGPPQTYLDSLAAHFCALQLRPGDAACKAAVACDAALLLGGDALLEARSVARRTIDKSLLALGTSAQGPGGALSLLGSAGPAGSNGEGTQLAVTAANAWEASAQSAILMPGAEHADGHAGEVKHVSICLVYPGLRLRELTGQCRKELMVAVRAALCSGDVWGAARADSSTSIDKSSSASEENDQDPGGRGGGSGCGRSTASGSACLRQVPAVQAVRVERITGGRYGVPLSVHMSARAAWEHHASSMQASAPRMDMTDHDAGSLAGSPRKAEGDTLRPWPEAPDLGLFLSLLQASPELPSGSALAKPCPTDSKVAWWHGRQAPSELASAHRKEPAPEAPTASSACSSKQGELQLALGPGAGAPTPGFSGAHEQPSGRSQPSLALNSGPAESAQASMTKRGGSSSRQRCPGYVLVDERGALVERPKKHPFALSRVYYHAAELPPEEQQTWFQPLGEACRWRQSAGEVHVIATGVPPGMRAKDLRVSITPRHLEVRLCNSGALLLSGRLARGVVPGESTWWCEGDERHDPGQGLGLGLPGHSRATPAPLSTPVSSSPSALPCDDLVETTDSASTAIVVSHSSATMIMPTSGSGRSSGDLSLAASSNSAGPSPTLHIVLSKMNLELVAGAGGRHADTWWPRLFKHHPLVEWDDSHKDYSDLPQEIMQAHARAEAQAETLRAQEKAGAGAAGGSDTA